MLKSFFETFKHKFAYLYLFMLYQDVSEVSIVKLNVFTMQHMQTLWMDTRTFALLCYTYNAPQFETSWK